MRNDIDVWTESRKYENKEKEDFSDEDDDFVTPCEMFAESSKSPGTRSSKDKKKSTFREK